MAILYKNSVKFPSVLSPIWLAVQVAEEVYANMEGQDLVVTSWQDGTHSRASLHWVGHAVDIRTKAAGISVERAQDLASEIARRLPPTEFDVVVESDHIHMEWQPKR